MQSTQDINVRDTVALITPRQLKQEQPASDRSVQTIVESRETVKRILAGEDPRLMVVIGPCSIHDEEIALEYATRLKRLSDQVEDRMALVMRVYFEKPRTTVGWKGLINDPRLDDTFDIGSGLRIARRILARITEMGLPTGTELLEPITPQYIADLITVASIGARTTESPTHRQMASGLSMPVGYKNGTDGNVQTAIDAIQAAKSPHSFLGIDPDGCTCIVNTKGNPWGYLILRGGRPGPNYSPADLAAAADRLSQVDASPRFVVDCSHANSNKDYRRQSIVWNDVLKQRVAGNNAIVGMMIESNLNAGKQPCPTDPSQLQYGVSITDGCIDWSETEALILEGHRLLGNQIHKANQIATPKS